MSDIKNKSNKEIFKHLIKTYLNKLFSYDKKNGNPELEVRFGTKGIRRLTKNDYDSVIKKLKSLGFSCLDESGETFLRINTEYFDKNKGVYKESNIRTIISGLQNIQEYCKTNSIKETMQFNMKNDYHKLISFEKKSPMTEKVSENRFDRLPTADFDEFNFRVSLNEEMPIKGFPPMVKTMIDDWEKNKKMFRLINRVVFKNDLFPIEVHMSIVRSSTHDGKRVVKTYRAEESGVFTNAETYEIELEVSNADVRNTGDVRHREEEEKLHYKADASSSTMTSVKSEEDQLEEQIRTVIKYVLSGLQNTNYPISYKEQKEVLQSYIKMLYGNDIPEEKKDPRYNYKFDFIGPSSVTLQMENIMPVNDNMEKSKNVRSGYVVTDKADGQRALLYVAPNGKIYLIDINMNVMFTGAITEEKDLTDSLIDGELVLHDKEGRFINMFVAFDMYYVHREDIRQLELLSFEVVDDKKKKYRYPLLKNFIKFLNPKSVVPSELCPIRIGYKKFYPNSPEIDIFAACNYILKKVGEGVEYEYDVDGLIFTPISFGVGSNKPGVAGPLTKITWEYSFKWKPPHYNTIDFLVVTKKGPGGDDIITPIFEDGINTLNTNSISQYKTLSLMCSFNEKKDGFINPCQDIIDDKLPEYEGSETKKTKNIPMQFYPTSPPDINAGLCRIMLKKDPNGNLKMFTFQDEVFEDNMIVEFMYDLTREGLWRWVPLRVRYDKTEELRLSLFGIGRPNYGNAYKVANSNWKSIHNPIPEHMIMTGENIPESILDEDVYYNRDLNEKESSKTLALRDFHRLYVKNMLITSVCHKGDTLIDYACGKAGDLPRWIKAQLSFVFGIDYFKSNLEDRLDGACARYLKKKKELKNIPYALFVNGDSRYNVRSGEAMLNDKAIQITKAIFGEGPKDEKILGAGVFRQYGKGIEGFNVSSCQFAIHYFTETLTNLQNFVRNVAECTKLNGYFIGTAYDGKLVFEMLKTKKLGESVEIYEDGVKIWEIKKNYDKETFENDASSLGYKIDVFQESINQMIPEFLVNFTYLERVMENYGFAIITRDEAKELGLPEGSGLFSELYANMLEEIKRNKYKASEYNKASNMNEYEKKISFLNRYFVYKKIRNVNAAKVELENIDETEEEIRYEKKETKQAVKVAKKVIKQEKPKIVKLKQKLELEAVEEEKPVEEEEQVIVVETEPKKEEKKKTKTKTKKTTTKKVKQELIIESDED